MKKMMVLVMVLVVILFAGCTASQQRELKTLKSEWSGGLDRTLIVYNLDGSVHATYVGKIDVQPSEGGKVLFDFEGKRYAYYNFPTEVIEN